MKLFNTEEQKIFLSIHLFGSTEPSWRHAGSFVTMHRLTSCGNVEACQFICSGAYGISAPPPGMEPVPPALQGRFLTSGPPGNSQIELFLFVFFEKMCKVTGSPGRYEEGFLGGKPRMTLKRRSRMSVLA